MNDFFVHLHVHSDYTLGLGASKIAELVDHAKTLGIPALALVDDSNMYGAMEFSKKAVAAGIQPIIGTKLWMQLGEKLKGSVILLAQNEVGYSNICSILTDANRPAPDVGREGSSGVLRLEVLEEHREGVIVLTGGRDGVINALLRADRDQDAASLLDFLHHYFGNRLYAEIARHGDENDSEKAIESKLIALATDREEFICEDGIAVGRIPLVATSEVWYTTRERHDAFEIMNAVKNNDQISVDQNGEIISRINRRFHMRPADVMAKLFSDLPDALENARQLAMRSAYKVSDRNPILPPFKTEGGRTEAEELRVQSWEGLEKRLEKLGIVGEARKPYEDRLERELGIIEGMKFPGYFLIVSDFIKWAKKQDIPVGPGRGSGAGSLVAYSLEITNLDPLQFGLLFERFLNPERVSMPDFDIDFCQDRREEVIRYVRDRYGDAYVSMIATFGEIKSKTAIKDVGRIIISDDFGGFGFHDLNELTKLLSMDGPNPQPISFSMNDPANPDFRALVNSQRKLAVLVRHAMKIEGLYRQQGSHAAGVIIGGDKLEKLVPVGWDNKTEMPVCQFNMKYSESAGLVKFDFLGLKTLSVIKETLNNIKETTGEDIDLDLIPLDHAPTYQMLAEGRSNGVFQVESGGMKKALKQIKPTRVEDLIAVGALYRPGPMEFIPLYAACKNGEEEAKYPEPVAETRRFLEETHGIMVYQEQVMLVAQVVAGYSLGGADLLRRAMGKKIKEEMDKQRGLFIEGAVKNGHAEADADALFDTIAKFANYGFNKSHAAAYGMITYHTAWLKKNYPAQFFAALLSYETDKPEKMALIKEDMDAWETPIPMLLPDINHSLSRFKPERLPDGSFGVRFGLTAIKGVSGDLAMLAAERANGPFKSLGDFHKRAGQQFNKSQLQKLTEAGAFDGFSKNRHSTFNILTALAKTSQKSGAQQDLFGGNLDVQIKKDKEEVMEWGNRADREFEAVGFYFGVHPLDNYEAKFKRIKVKRYRSLMKWMLEKKKAELNQMRLAGLVEFVDRKFTRTGNAFLSVKFAEKHDAFNVAFFFSGDERNDRISTMETMLRNAKTGRRPVVVEANISFKDNFTNLSLYGKNVFDADEMVANERGNIEITVNRDAVVLTGDEQKLLAKIEDVHGTSHAKADELRQGALKRKAGEIRLLLNHYRSSDPNAVPVSVRLVHGQDTTLVQLQDRYLIDQAAEMAIKAMDGVESLREILSDPASEKRAA